MQEACKYAHLYTTWTIMEIWHVHKNQANLNEL